MKTIAISQPRYLPAMNYFQRIHSTDIFVILDNVQHQRRSFEHRNRIKSLSGETKWISIPVDRRDNSRMVIKDMKFSDLDWVAKHKAVITNSYSKAPFFDKDLLDEFYCDISGLDFVGNIQKLNIRFCEHFNIEHEFVMASTLDTQHQRDRLLREIVEKLGGDVYVSGTNGRDYISGELFSDIKLVYHDFRFPAYRQIGGDFVPWMCIWDQVFNLGLAETERLIKTKVVFNDA